MNGNDLMIDILYLAIALIFFLASLALTAVCRRLLENWYDSLLDCGPGYSGSVYLSCLCLA